ncbi:MAG: type II toxin-antitoxin system HigB family toxin, partial [Methylomonas lenta]|nr:type II toxin-antitoxin system HigB family toxin [Methylomonas lenta]
MRIIAKSTIKKFWEQPEYRDAKGPLESWYEEVIKANWASPQEIKAQYRNASICG